MPESETMTSAVDEFRIDEEYPSPGATVLTVHGDADLHAAPELRERITAAIDGGANTVVLDLSDVAFVDSMALGVLLGGMKRARARGGELRLVVPAPDIRRIFEITLLDRVIPLDGTRLEALTAAVASRQALG
jgi:anti-sigma B factor antagonist